MDGETPVCYWKGPVTDFLDKNPDYKWLTMKNDNAIGVVTNDYEAGLIQIKMTLVNKALEPNVNYAQFESWKMKPPKRLNSYKIRCYIF